MKKKTPKFVLLFFILFCMTFLCGAGLLLGKRTFAFSAESVFAAVPTLALPNTAYYSALPYAFKSTQKLVEPEANFPTPMPKTESFATYNAEPAAIENVLQIKNSTDYTVDIEALLNAPFPLESGGPKVLIVHTHTSEAYAQSESYSYVPSDAYRTENTDYNICRVGKQLAETLESHGISVIHDTKSHDYPSYSGCYGRSLSTIEKNLAEHPSIEVVIDLHRDAISDADGNYLKTSAEIEGKQSAQALIVVGTDAGGLPHSTWQNNLSLGLKVQKAICDMYPGLSRPLHLRTERFNGHASAGALLIEIGSNGNTMEEALYCAELVGNALSKTLLALMH